ncbi:MAG: bifunctional 5,10-methylenetetrahydrofolate dehydrogenase/5,10-methenyltetrahydrofolate cyclohydrolase [Thermoplasmata archaeon]|nr:bifunctional 5,10-methylenetetrahydrofolate dehydrogenase/5,10-methenyltetrahydrofolate cyclohydrolase [Thermoplasmata archaeon]
MQLIDGKAVAQEIREKVKKAVEEAVKEGITPGLAVVLVGDNPASKIYVSSKARVSRELGIYSETITLPGDISQKELEDVLKNLNSEKRFHGILLQLPLPPQLDEERAIESISPEKDVDGFHPVNMGYLSRGHPRFIPCTPLGVLYLLHRYNIPVEGSSVSVLGRSNIVGRPLSILLSLKKPWANAAVTLLHSRVKDLKRHLKDADIVISAVGRPEMLRGEDIKDGAVAIDVGINRVEDPAKEKGYRLVGDFHWESISEKASAATPVPGGVGPMTVAMLMVNTYLASARVEGIPWGIDDNILNSILETKKGEKIG